MNAESLKYFYKPITFTFKVIKFVKQMGFWAHQYVNVGSLGVFPEIVLIFQFTCVSLLLPFARAVIQQCI